jgi:hypothetical protein
VVGYWGLSIPEAYASPHRLTIDGRRLSAWCAWDTLFLPQLLGQTADVESTSPTAGATVHVTVTPDALEYVDPVGAQRRLCCAHIAPAAGLSDEHRRTSGWPPLRISRSSEIGGHGARRLLHLLRLAGIYTLRGSYITNLSEW